MAEKFLKQPISSSITNFVYFNSLVRDTLEYTLLKDSYNVDFYKYKQRGIINEPKINSPLHQFIVNNGEKAEDFKKQIEEFGEELYGEDSTILSVAQEGLRVDHGQHLRIFELVHPLHEQIQGIIYLHVNAAKEGNVLEEPIVKLVAEDDRFYRGVMLMSITMEIERKFQEFNNIRRENNGAESASSNFVQQELGKLCNIVMAQKQLARCSDSIYINAIDHATELIEYMTAKRDLPEGKNFGEIFNETNEACRALVADAEGKWRAIYDPCISAMIDNANEARAKREAEEAKAPKEDKPVAEEKSEKITVKEAEKDAREAELEAKKAELKGLFKKRK